MVRIGAAGYGGAMQPAGLLDAPWRDPVDVLLGLGDEPWVMGFVSGGASARWSYVAAEPDATLVLSADDPRDPFAALSDLAGPFAPRHPDGPPFQGGVAGLASYDLGDRIERLGLARHDGWADFACARYPAVLAFDHQEHRLLAVGRRPEAALDWLERPRRRAQPPGAQMRADDPTAYECAVAQVVERIHAGEIFQANIARRWLGRLAPGATPVDVLAALAASPAPFASYLRLADRALVSNSPERFLRVIRDAEGLAVETQPIKGTAPRGRCAEEDARNAAGLAASSKDRAENLMIVDLMRNDLARVCAPGTVKTPELCRLAAFTNVHHLVSTVTGRLTGGRTAPDLLRAALPPGSITGAPKVQAMKVIAELEPARGPFFGAMFHLGFDGGLDSNVLIRTATFVADEDGWGVEARAGAGIVADSDPASERRETEQKISALARALAQGAQAAG